MESLIIQSSISMEQLYAIVRQLPDVEKMKLRKILDEKSIKKQWAAVAPSLIEEVLSMNEIVAEIKAYRSEKAQNQ